MASSSKNATNYPRSKYINVFWSKTQQKWNHRVKDPMTMKQKCGTHDNEAEAARAADMETVRLMRKYPDIDMNNKINFPGLVDMCELEDILMNDSDSDIETTPIPPVPPVPPVPEQHASRTPQTLPVPEQHASRTTPIPPVPEQQNSDPTTFAQKRKRSSVFEYSSVLWVVNRLYRSIGVRCPTQQDWESSFSAAAKNARCVLEQTQARFPDHDLDMERDFIQDADFGNWETGFVTHESVVELLKDVSIHVVRMNRHEVLSKSHETFLVYGTVPGKTQTQAVMVMDQRIHAPDIMNDRGKHITRPVEDLWNYFIVVTDAYYIVE